MSEYQYYEFSALDQPLTSRQQGELRACSSRAEITARGFVNEYHWGDLKAAPLDWMARYFDAHVYSANWGSCRFMLALPLDALDGATVARYSGTQRNRLDEYGGAAFTISAKPGRWIISWALDLEDGGDEERFWQEDGPGWMERLQGLRDELLRGDMRPLYLGWMARLCSCDLEDDAVEPPVPPGLGSLTPEQSALAEFLLLDPDLLSVAATGSAELAPPDDDEADAAAWLAQLTEAELRQSAAQLLREGGRVVERQMRAKLASWRREHRPPEAAAPLRTVAEIESGRAAAEQARLEQERRRREARERRAQAERARHLAAVAEQAEAIWARIAGLLSRGTGASYGQAEQAVKELHAALAAAGRGDEFRQGLVRSLSAHGKRPAWLARLKKAGLM